MSIEFDFLVRGLLIGFSIAAPVGPMSVLCMQRVLAQGWRYGLISGLGIASADATYGCVAALGLTFVSDILVSQQNLIRVIGGLFLVYLGVKTWRTLPPQNNIQPTAKNNFWQAYFSTYFLTLTSPLTILSFAAIFGGFGIGPKADYGRALVLVVGVLFGSSFWWLFLTSIVNLLRKHFTYNIMIWINRIAGFIIAGFGSVIILNFILVKS